MDGPIFDAMLKTALEEALRQDMEQLERTPEVRQSSRQRKRMKKMLADPWGYVRRQAAAPEKPLVRRRNPARWAAVAVVAALLTGTAAGYALRGGAFFQRMFDTSPWAAQYGGAADTEQLLDMGSQTLGAVVEDEKLRLELVDAVSDGQFAMVAIHMTLLDPAVLEGLAMELPHFLDTDISRVSGGPEDSTVGSYGTSVRPWLGPDGAETGGYSLIFSIDDGALLDGGDYRITLRDLGFFGKDDYEVLAPGTWTMDVSLLPGEVVSRAPEQVCEIAGTAWVLERVTCSALALKLEFRGGEAEVSFRDLSSSLNPVVRLKNGMSIGSEGYSCGIVGSMDDIEVTLEFQMPIDVETVESVTVCGQEVFLRG